MSERVTDAEAIARAPEIIQYFREMGHPQDADVVTALLALARDGVRFRALQERGRDCGRPVYVGPKLGTPSAEKDDG